ncbi:MAG: hypothetical protein PVI24_17700, partial [Myxococcales bacterium]
TVADSVADTGTEAAADTATDTGSDSAADAKAPPKPRKKALPPKPARLDVIVIPWGDVWINGERWGPAPMMNERLKPGRYRISAGQGGPTKTRTVRLKPGEHKTLDFDLTR